MSSANAVVFRAPGRSLGIEAVELDRPYGNEVVVRTVAAGVCRSDLGRTQPGGIAWGGPEPVVLGHESAGVVETVGDAVTHVRPGDHVVTCASAFCGSCERCLTGRPALCIGTKEVVGENRVLRLLRNPRGQGKPYRLSQGGKPVLQFSNIGSFADRMLISENNVVKIDDDVPMDRAAILGCGLITGIGAVLNTAAVRAGTTVAVFGCGGVGLGAIQAAQIAGARQIFAVDIVPWKLELARQVGATHTVDSSREDAVAAIRGATREDEGVDYAIHAALDTPTARQGFDVLGASGTLVIAGGMSGDDAEFSIPASVLLHEEKRVVGCLMGSNRFRVDIPRYLDLYRQGRLKLDELITRTASLDQVGDAFRWMTGGEVARVVVHVGQ